MTVVQRILARAFGATLRLFHRASRLTIVEPVGESDWTMPRQSTLEGFAGDLSSCRGVSLPDLEPLTTLLVRTCHSVYRIIVLHGPIVLIQGGAFFPDATCAHLDGSRLGGGPLKLGWIGVGSRLAVSCDGRRFVTSPVRAITTEDSLDPDRHVPGDLTFSAA